MCISKIMHMISNGNNRELPSAAEIAKNLLKATATVVTEAVKGEEVFTSKEESDRRIAICTTCDYFDRDRLRCKVCGCFMETKTKLAAMSCPEEKW